MIHQYQAILKDLTKYISFIYYENMKIIIEYMGFFKIKDVPSKSEIEVDPDTSIEELLDRLEVKKEHRKFLVPLVQRQRKTLDYQLQDGDDLFLYYPVGGG